MAHSLAEVGFIAKWLVKKTVPLPLGGLFFYKLSLTILPGSVRQRVVPWVSCYLLAGFCIWPGGFLQNGKVNAF